MRLRRIPTGHWLVVGKLLGLCFAPKGSQQDLTICSLPLAPGTELSTCNGRKRLTFISTSGSHLIRNMINYRCAQSSSSGFEPFVDVSYPCFHCPWMIQIFKAAVEKFIKARPREWLKFNCFRSGRVEVDHGFLEYYVSATHREGWQHVSALLQSKSDLVSFTLELQKRMGMRYRPPPLPVDLSMVSRDPQKTTADGQASSAPFVPLPSWGDAQDNDLGD
jgi:hypothetical protein